MRRVYIPKAERQAEAAGDPDDPRPRVQMAAVLVLEPIFEADLQPEQYAYRPGRSALDAVSEVHATAEHGPYGGGGRGPCAATSTAFRMPN